MTSLGVKTCGKSEFEIFEAKKRFPDSGNAYCVLKRKAAKKNFCLKTTPFGVKMCGKSVFDIYKFPRIQEKPYIDAKIRENHLLIGLNHWLNIILQKI
jgi:hypothetical protein